MAGLSAEFSTMSALEDEGSVDSLGISTPVDTAASTPDSTPSRRSSRKKQSKFSSDFEYYSPGARKKEIAEAELKIGTDAAPKGKRGRKKGIQQTDVEEPIENEEENNQGEKKKRQMTRKVAVKMQKRKEHEKEELDDFEEENSLQFEMGKVKAAAKKTAVKGKKVGRKKKLNTDVVMSTKDEESDKGEGEEKDDNKLVKGQKRKKKGDVSKVKGKKIKTELLGAQEEKTSDEEASLYKVGTQKKMPKLKKQTGASSPLAQNLMKKLAEVSSDSGSVSDLSPASGPKRKLSVTSGENDVPSKTFRSAQKNKQALAAAGLVRRIPESDPGMIKPAPTAKSVKTSATTVTEPKMSAAATKKMLDSKTSVNTSASSSLTGEGKSEETLLTTNFSLGNDQTAEAAATGKASTKEVSGVKTAEKMKSSGKVVKFETKKEGDEKLGTKVQIIRKPDGTVIKKKVLSQGGQIIELEGKQKKVKVLKKESEETLMEKKKLMTQGEKSKSPAVNALKKKHVEKAVVGGKQNSKVAHTKAGDSGVTKSGSEGVNKHEANSQKVDDLLRRGIFHKKKSHQPFGNRKATKVIGKDVKVESAGDVSEKQDQAKKKPVVHKVEEKTEIKKPTGTERRKSNDGSKLEKGQSKKGERRKSAESTKKSDKQLSLEESKDDASGGPPVLIPVTAMGKVKHKHHKVEHEVPLDMTMMDLFKPDALVIHDHQKKDVGTPGGKPTSAAMKSQYSVDVYDSSSFVKPENLHHVLIEHQYSKSSPVILKQDSQSSASTSTSIGRDDDIESVSHKQTVIMDMNLPDQILEESEEPVTEAVISDPHEVSPSAAKDDLLSAVIKKDIGGRPSILESLDTELKEGGTEFRIVGQVEVGRIPAMAREESISTTQESDHQKQTEILANKQSDSGKSSEVRKLSSDTRKLSTEKRKDSSDKKDNTHTRSDSQEGMKRKKKSKSDGPDGKKQGSEGNEEGDLDSEEHNFEDDQNDLDWEPNDPNTLYCICRMPHNNRFMICCDKCEEWFHGTCVGVTKARGKEMEEKEEEYICPLCSKSEGSQPVEQQLTQSKPSDTTPSKSKLLQRCVGRKCSKSPRPGSVYCSNECIMSHAQESLKALREEQLHKKTTDKNTLNDSSKSSSSANTSSPSAASPSLDTVEVVERQTGKVLKGPSAPTQKGLHRWLEQHPTYEVVQPHKRHRSRSSSSKDDKSGDKEGRSHDELKSADREHRTSTDRDKKSDHSGRSRHGSSSSKDSGKRSDGERHGSASQKSEASSSTSRSEEKKDDGPNQIRINVRTALRDCLSARAQEAEDIMLSSAEIKNLAVTIEEQLFDLFNDTGHKYRTKYRSLVFNIKDQKNKGLFRKILTGKIKPHKLVQMSTEELASRELAKWREQATKHELEMIEKTEQEAMKASETSKHVIKKTHKGEVEVEDEDLSILETRLEERKEPEPEPQEEQTHAAAIDTTDQHRAHLFDLNCKVCTGKIVPGPEEQAAIAAAEKSVVVALLKPQVELAPESSEMEKIDFEKAEEIVKEALQTVQKMEQSVLSMSKIVSVSPKLEETPPLSPKLRTSRRESSSSTSSTASSSARKRVVVRSPDSALQAGLETKIKFTPTGPMLWKGFVSMLDVAKFFTSAYRVSGPTDHVVIPDTVHILGRISPEHMWDYLSKIRQAGSKDVTVIRFVPGSDDEKVAYVHLYSYLNSRSRCGVAGNMEKQIKDFYLVPLASHSKIPRALLPFDGPGLEENRPHMLLGILVRQRGKHGGEANDTGSTGSGIRKPASHSSTNSATKHVTPPVNRDPRLAKHAAKEGQPKVSPVESPSSSGSSTGEARPKLCEEYEPEYIPSPVILKTPTKLVAEYVPTPTLKRRESGDERTEDNVNEVTPLSDESSSRDIQDEKENQHHIHKDHHHHREHHHQRHHHRHHHHHKKTEKGNDLEDDSEPYSPGKEAEPYSPSQEAAADEPYDPGDENLMDDSGVPLVTSSDVSSSTSSGSVSLVTAEVAVVATVLDASSTSSELAQDELTSVSNFPTVLPSEASCNTSELVEQMARSNVPQEISSLMVAALSAAKSSQEQQTLLVELTKKVEERKLQLAEAARQGAACVTSRSSESNDVEAARQGAACVTSRSSDSNDAEAARQGAACVTSRSSESNEAARQGAACVTSRSSESNEAARQGPACVTSRSSESNEAARQGAACVTSRSSESNDVDTFSRGSEDKSNSLGESFSGLVDVEVVSSSSLCSFDTSAATSNSGQGSTSSMPSDVQIVPEQNSSSSSSSSSSFLFSLAGSTSHSSCALPGLASDSGNCSKPLVTELPPSAPSSSSLPASASQGPPTKESRDAGGIKFSFTKSRVKTQHALSTSTAEVFSSETAEAKPKLPMLHEEAAPQESFTSDISEYEHSGGMPHVLKALMKDVMGITQCTSEKKLMKLLKAEAEMTKKAARETAKQGEESATDRQLLAELTETQKLLKVEEVKKIILSDLKKPKLSANTGSATAASAIVTVGNSDSQLDAGADQTDTPPSIDELLDKLKKGGFQFRQTDSGSISALSSAVTSMQPDSLTSIDSQCSSMTAHPSFVTSQTSSVALPSSYSNTSSSITASATAGQSTNPQQKNDLTSSQLKSVTISSDFGAAAETAGATGPERTFGDYDERLSSAAQKWESQVLCPGPPAYPAIQKNPLDPLAFSQLPADAYSHPPPSLPPTLPPLPHPPLRPVNPHFTQPPLEPRVPFQPVLIGGPLAVPRVPAQAPRPGTEPSILGVVSDDLPPADVDLRSINLPPLPPEPLPPPLPTQPSPSFPAGLGSQFSHPPRGDMDYRSKDSHNSHHGYPQHRRGGNRSFYRH